MIIDVLALHNVGIFKGTHTLELTCINEKNIILIGGLNGRGKTTILEAVLFALYGKRVRNFTCGNWTFEQYLDKLRNHYAESKTSYVELLFRVDEEGQEQAYKIRREWESDAKLVNRVWKEEMEDKALASNWDMFIEDILPIAVAPFFFFDGEKISELASADNDAGMIESIKNLLGLNILEQTMRDLRTVIKNNQRNIEVVDYANELSDLQIRISDVRKEISALEVEKSACESNIHKKESRLEVLDAEFSASGGTLFEQRSELKKRKQQIEIETQMQYERLLSMASGDMPLYLIKDLLIQVEEKAELEKREKDEEIVLRRLPLIFNEYKTTEDGIDFDINKFLAYIEDKKQHIECSYNLTEEGYIRLRTIEDTESEKKLAVKASMDKLKKFRYEQEEISNQLEVDLNDITIQNIYDEIKELTGETALLRDKLNKIVIKLDEKYAQTEKLEGEEQKLLDKAASEMDIMDDTKRMIEYAGKELRILEIFKNRLQKQKAAKLSETITNCFKTIISKKDLIHFIELDDQMTTFTYYNERNERIKKELLSAGEKQLLVIAILWGLGICSDKRLPVVIDTPLGRLDSYHREMLVKNYFPKASRQMIILSTDQEITNSDYKTLKEHTCREYTLVYDSDTKSSRISEEYFGDVR